MIFAGGNPYLPCSTKTPQDPARPPGRLLFRSGSKSNAKFCFFLCVGAVSDPGFARRARAEEALRVRAHSGFGPFYRASGQIETGSQAPRVLLRGERGSISKTGSRRCLEWEARAQRARRLWMAEGERKCVLDGKRKALQRRVLPSTCTKLRSIPRPIEMIVLCTLFAAAKQDRSTLLSCVAASAAFHRTARLSPAYDRFHSRLNLLKKGSGLPSETPLISVHKVLGE